MASRYGAGHGELLSHRTALRLKVLYKTDEVKRVTQTSGYFNSPDERYNLKLEISAETERMP